MAMSGTSREKSSREKPNTRKAGGRFTAGPVKPGVPARIRLRKNDVVKVITGRDKGKTGRVLEIDRETGRVVVEGVMMVKRHTKANPQRQIKGGIAEKEASIHISNVMMVTSDGKATRIGTKVEGEGAAAKRVRIARTTGEELAVKR